MRFTKMHGAGNDYICVDCFDEVVEEPPAVALAVCDRHFGIGADGLILIMPSNVADVRMRMFNVDGSEAEMCGNGLRCLAKYAFDHARAEANPMTVETAAGIRTVELMLGPDGKVARATVDMGRPVLEPRDIPVDWAQDRAVDIPIEADRHEFRATCVSMGNPHAVIHVDDVQAIRLEQVGPVLENHPAFPQRTNVHFVQVHHDGEVTMRTWERGCGVVLACGTGASAVCVAGVLTARSGRQILAHLPGGDLALEWREENDRVYLTGPAAEVFTGRWPADS